jgi:hypothetical protein
MSKSEDARRYAEWIWEHYLGQQAAALGDATKLDSALRELTSNLQAAKRVLAAYLIFDYAASTADRAVLAALVQAGYAVPDAVLENPEDDVLLREDFLA